MVQFYHVILKIYVNVYIRLSKKNILKNRNSKLLLYNQAFP